MDSCDILISRLYEKKKKCGAYCYMDYLKNVLRKMTKS